MDRDIHTGEIYHCSSCGVQLIFQAVSAEDYVPPPGAEEGLPLPQSRSPVHSPLQDDLQPD